MAAAAPPPPPGPNRLGSSDFHYLDDEISDIDTDAAADSDDDDSYQRPKAGFPCYICSERKKSSHHLICHLQSLKKGGHGISDELIDQMTAGTLHPETKLKGAKRIPRGGKRIAGETRGRPSKRVKKVEKGKIGGKSGKILTAPLKGKKESAGKKLSKRATGNAPKSKVQPKKQRGKAKKDVVATEDGQEENNQPGFTNSSASGALLPRQDPHLPMPDLQHSHIVGENSLPSQLALTNPQQQPAAYQQLSDVASSRNTSRQPTPLQAVTRSMPGLPNGHILRNGPLQGRPGAVNHYQPQLAQQQQQQPPLWQAYPNLASSRQLPSSMYHHAGSQPNTHAPPNWPQQMHHPFFVQQLAAGDHNIDVGTGFHPQPQWQATIPPSSSAPPRQTLALGYTHPPPLHRQMQMSTNDFRRRPSSSVERGVEVENNTFEDMNNIDPLLRPGGHPPPPPSPSPPSGGD